MASKSFRSKMVSVLTVCGLIWFGVKQYKAWFPERNIPNFVHDAFRNAELELFSLSPVQPPEHPDGILFHGFESLGSMKFKNYNVGALMIDALDESVGDVDEAKCYWPRHGVRCDYNGDQIDLIVCFECAPLTIYRNGKSVYSAKVSNSAKPVFDQMLKHENLPIDTPPQ